MLQELRKLKGAYHDVMMFPGRQKLLLFGTRARLVDLPAQTTVQYIPGMANGTAAVSHDRRYVFIVAARDGRVIAELYLFQDQLVRIRQAAVKGYNADGGKPFFSPDDRYAFFSVEAKELYRFDCETGELKCIWRPRWENQFFQTHVNGDQILIVLSHHGLELIGPDGKLIRQMAFQKDSIALKACTIFADWIGGGRIFLYYAMAAAASEDYCQIVSPESGEPLPVSKVNAIPFAKESGIACVGVESTADRRFLILKEYSFQASRSFVSVFLSDTMQEVFRADFARLHSLSVSPDSQVLFISAEKNCLVDFNKLRNGSPAALQHPQ